MAFSNTVFCSHRGSPVEGAVGRPPQEILPEQDQGVEGRRPVRLHSRFRGHHRGSKYTAKQHI